MAKQIRSQAQANAARVTNTNDTFGSVVAKGLKKVLNSLPGLQWARLGDIEIPFSKIPGNVIANSLGVSGLDFPRAVYEFKKASSESDASGKKADFSAPIKTMVRTVGGLMTALLIAYSVKDEAGFRIRRLDKDIV